MQTVWADRIGYSKVVRNRQAYLDIECILARLYASEVFGDSGIILKATFPVLSQISVLMLVCVCVYVCVFSLPSLTQSPESVCVCCGWAGIICV